MTVAVDTRKPVVVVGKGISLMDVPDPGGEFYVMACSEAIRACERADWLACNDTAAWDYLEDADIAKARAVLLPTFLHQPLNTEGNPSGYTHWSDCARRLAKFQPVHLYQLHTAPVQDENVPSFGRCRSVSDSAIGWLLFIGFRRIVTTGIEWSGDQRYAARFDRQQAKGKRHRMSIWQHTLQRIESYGATVERLEETELCQQSPQ